jgi:hypothetical protein
MPVPGAGEVLGPSLQAFPRVEVSVRAKPLLTEQFLRGSRSGPRSATERRHQRQARVRRFKP